MPPRRVGLLHTGVVAELSERVRRRLDAIFGDVLPDVTRDETDEPETDQAGDQWLRANRPPHHDRE